MNKRFLRFSAQDQILFAKRLSLLIRAGIPILTGLQMLHRGSPNKSAQQVLGEVAADIERGQFLSTSLGKYPNVFSEFALNIIRVGEVSGTLHENLDYLAQELQKKQMLRRKIVGALAYPIFIVLATIGISGLLTIYIFPKILPIFRSFRFELPWTTQTLIFVSDLLINYGLWIFLGMVGLAGGVWFITRIHRVRLYFDYFLLKLPFLGRVFQAYYLANFCRTLGLLLKSEVKIVEATKITATTVSNLRYQQVFARCADSMNRGEKISIFLQNYPSLFPHTLVQMVDIGETAGSLSATLLYLAELYEQEVEHLTKNMSTLLEPALMGAMGILVGFVAVSIITPIYEITQHLRP